MSKDTTNFLSKAFKAFQFVAITFTVGVVTALSNKSVDYYFNKSAKMDTEFWLAPPSNWALYFSIVTWSMLILFWTFRWHNEKSKREEALKIEIEKREEALKMEIAKLYYLLNANSDLIKHIINDHKNLESYSYYMQFHRNFDTIKDSLSRDTREIIKEIESKISKPPI